MGIHLEFIPFIRYSFHSWSFIPLTQGSLRSPWADTCRPYRAFKEYSLIIEIFRTLNLLTH